MDERLHNSRFLRACRGEATDVTPIWLMRQAGRYMQEYRDIRAKTTFLGLCKTPELAAQVTLDAQRILGVDAAILFADLLPILEPMGLTLTYEEGEGPRIHNPVRTGADVDALAAPDPRESMPFVGEAIRIIRRELPPDIPLIGFAGAPFTLAAYAIEGGASRNYLHAKGMMLGDAGAWRSLMEKFTAQITHYLQAQIEWGVQAVQLFDSWVGCLSPADYREHVLPWVREIIGAVSGKVQVIYFGTGTATLLTSVMGRESSSGNRELGIGNRQAAVGSGQSAVGSRESVAGSQQSAVSSRQASPDPRPQTQDPRPSTQDPAPKTLHPTPDVLGIDWHTPLARGWEAGARAVQGNMDPVALFAPREVVLQKAREVLDEAAQRPEGVGHIFNLGHGILPKTPVDNVRALVDFVHDRQ